MSAECLCIVSDLPAYKGIMKNKENSLIVSDSEIEKADYIEKVLELDKKEVLLKNKTFVEDYASLEKNKEKFNNVIKLLALKK